MEVKFSKILNEKRINNKQIINSGIEIFPDLLIEKKIEILIKTIW